MFGRFIIDKPINLSYYTEEKSFLSLDSRLDDSVLDFIRKIFLDVEYKIVVGLPTSPTHIFLSMKLQPSYLDCESRTIYLYYNFSRESVFLFALIYELSRAYFDKLVVNKDIEKYNFFREIFGYYSPTKLGVYGVLKKHFRELTSIFAKNIFTKTGYHLENIYSPRVIAYILDQAFYLDPNKIIETLSGGLESIVAMISKIDYNRKLKKAGFSALYSVFPEKKDYLEAKLGVKMDEFGVGHPGMIFGTIHEEMADKLSLDLLISIESLCFLVKERGKNYVLDLYGSLVERIKKFVLLKNTIDMMFSDPDTLITSLDEASPGSRSIAERILKEQFIDNIFGIKRTTED